MFVKALLLASVTVLAMPVVAVAQTPSVAATTQQGVLVFAPDFFASSSPNTALDMIGRLPGFALDEGNTNTRGFAGAAGNVLIDGDRPASKSDGLDAVLQRISADSVERIELIRGGAPGIDMQGRAVIANVVLKRTVQIERVVEVNSYIYPDAFLGPLLKASWSRREGDNQLEGSFSATSDRSDDTGDGYRRRYDAAGNSTQIADLDLWDRYRNVGATGVWQGIVGGGKLRINGLAGWFNSRNTIDTLIRSGTGTDEFSSGERDSVNTELGVNWSRPFGDRIELELIGLQRNETGSSLSESRTATRRTAFGDDTSSGESIGRAVLRFRQNERWTYEGGGEAAYNVLDSATTYAENGVPVILPSAAVKVEEVRGEVFGQTSWRPNSRFTLEAGLRVEVSQISQSGDADRSETFVFPKPRLQLTWTPVADNQFRLRIEREVGQLNFDDFVASADVDLNQVEGGNPDLRPQSSWVLEGVYERRFWGEGTVTLYLAHAEFQNRIDVIPLTGGFEAVGNVGDGSSDVQKIELTLPMDRLGLSNARLQTSVFSAQTSLTDPLTGETRPFSGRTSFGCDIRFNQDLREGRWSYGFEHDCNVDDPVQYRIREVRYIEEEPELEVFIQWKPRPDLTLRLDINNATDREQRRERLVYSGPRDTAPLAFREERGTRQGPFVFLQARKTF